LKELCLYSFFRREDTRLPVFAGYQLAESSAKLIRLKPNRIYIEFPITKEQCLPYRVIGLDNKPKAGFIPLEPLPGCIPENIKTVVDLEPYFITILEILSAAGHISQDYLKYNSEVTRDYINQMEEYGTVFDAALIERPTWTLAHSYKPF
jgi:hypothetical protein